MRIAILSDIHGNNIALEAVLNDIQTQGGVEAYWVLGDLAAIGHAPVKVLELLDKLPNTYFVRGNTDRDICSGDYVSSTVEAAAANPSRLAQLVEVVGDFAWAQGAVTTAGWLDWISDLPLEFRVELPNGTRVLCVHASPGLDGGSGIHTGMNEAEITALLSGCQDGLVCVGHTHQPFNMTVGKVRIINPGSVSNPVGTDVRASYATLEADGGGYAVEFRRVAYDNQEVIRILEQIRHPARRFIIQHMRGEWI